MTHRTSYHLEYYLSTRGTTTVYHNVRILATVNKSHQDCLSRYKNCINHVKVLLEVLQNFRRHLQCITKNLVLRDPLHIHLRWQKFPISHTNEVFHIDLDQQSVCGTMVPLQRRQYLVMHCAGHLMTLQSCTSAQYASCIIKKIAHTIEYPVVLKFHF